MVAHNTFRRCEENQAFLKDDFKFKAAVDVNNCL